MARERRGAPGAIRRNAKALVDEVLLPHLAERPQPRLDVLGGEGPVGVAVIEPETHPLAEGHPVLDVLVDALAAELVEPLDPDLVFDLDLARDLELLLDLDLDRQAVRVPTRFPLDVKALHCLVAAEQVFERASQDVVGGRLAVGGGRALVEDKPLPTFTKVERLLEGAFRLPLLHQLDLQLGEADFLIDFLEHSHSTEIRICLSLGRVFAKTHGTTQIPEANTSDPHWVTAREGSPWRARPAGCVRVPGLWR